MFNDEDWECEMCGHSEIRHDGGMSCVECSCREFIYPDDDTDT
jgi:uncharacterized Zn finger protein (UPF0148 family)